MVLLVLVQVARGRVLFPASRTLVLFLLGVYNEMAVVQRLTRKELSTVPAVDRN